MTKWLRVRVFKACHAINGICTKSWLFRAFYMMRMVFFLGRNGQKLSSSRAWKSGSWVSWKDPCNHGMSSKFAYAIQIRIDWRKQQFVLKVIKALTAKASSVQMVAELAYFPS